MLYLYPETRATPAQHHYQIMHPPRSGEHRNYLDVALGLQPRTITQRQGNKLRPCAIYYADDTVLLFPQLPFLRIALPAILRRTISLFICVSVCECEPWNRDGIARRDGNARPTCWMMILIWKTITVKHNNFSYPHKKNLHCRVHVPVEAVRVAD